MDSDMKWIAVVLTVIFGGLFGGVALGEYQRHQERMECMKQKGEYIDKTCLFRNGLAK